MSRKKILITLNYYSRLFHRASALATSILGVVMILTGLALKFPKVFAFSFLDPFFVRYLHNALSPFFTVALGLMILTGLFMYFFQWMMKKLG